MVLCPCAVSPEAGVRADQVLQSVRGLERAKQRRQAGVGIRGARVLHLPVGRSRQAFGHHNRNHVVQPESLHIGAQPHQPALRAPDRARRPHLRRLLGAHPLDIGAQRIFRRSRLGSPPPPRYASSADRPARRSQQRTHNASRSQPEPRFIDCAPYLRQPSLPVPAPSATARTTLPPIFSRTFKLSPDCCRLKRDRFQSRIHHRRVLFDEQLRRRHESRRELIRSDVSVSVARDLVPCLASPIRLATRTSRPGPAGMDWRHAAAASDLPVAGSSISRNTLAGDRRGRAC